MRLRAYAKINLYLCVDNNKNNNGLHKIKSLFQNISLFDTITIEKKQGELVYEGPNFENNTLFKVLKLLEVKKGIKISLSKQIPTQAGLGGGSSDAAALLVGLSSLLNMNIKESEMLSFASQVGSDVPFFIKGGTCLVQGVGEKIERLNDITETEILLIYPTHKVSTSEAYKKLDKSRIHCRGSLNQLYERLQSKNLKEINQFSFNSFDELFKNEQWLIDAKKILKDNGGINPMLTGSGSGVFAYSINSKERPKDKILKLKFVNKGYEIEYV